MSRSSASLLENAEDESIFALDWSARQPAADGAPSDDKRKLFIWISSDGASTTMSLPPTVRPGTSVLIAALLVPVATIALTPQSMEDRSGILGHRVVVGRRPGSNQVDMGTDRRAIARNASSCRIDSFRASSS